MSDFIKRTLGAMVIIFTVYTMIRVPNYFGSSRMQIILAEAILLAVVFIVYNYAFSKKEVKKEEPRELTYSERIYQERLRRQLENLTYLKRKYRDEYPVMYKLFLDITRNIEFIQQSRFELSPYMLDVLNRNVEEFEEISNSPDKNSPENKEMMEKIKHRLFMVDLALASIFNDLFRGRKIDRDQLDMILHVRLMELDRQDSTSR